MNIILLYPEYLFIKKSFRVHFLLTESVSDAYIVYTLTLIESQLKGLVYAIFP